MSEVIRRPDRAFFTCFREVADGNDLTGGIRRCFLYTVDMRRCNAAGGLQIPLDNWGNALGMNLAPAPPAPATSSPDRISHLRLLLAYAACAIHASIQAMHTDASFNANGMLRVKEMGTVQSFKKQLDGPGFMPFRDCAALITSWRGGSLDRTDFGQGTPYLMAGGSLQPFMSHVSCCSWDSPALSADAGSWDLICCGDLFGITVAACQNDSLFVSFYRHNSVRFSQTV